MDRRRFLQVSALATAGLTIGPSFTFGMLSKNKVAFLLDPKDIIANAPSALWALDQLREELKKKGIDTLVVQNLSDVPSKAHCVVVSEANSKLAGTILNAKKIKAPAKPESLALAEGKLSGHTATLACGSDERGLVYALLELADRVRYADESISSVEINKSAIEQPANSVRSIYRCFTNETEDKPWFNNREMWKEYLTMLASQRFNRFSLTLGMGYNTPNHIKDSYFFFPYPFFLVLPGYDVRMGNLPVAERDNNLKMLKFISEETVKRGMQFQLGLWSHGRDWKNSDDVNYPLLGVNENNHAPYCRDALAALLKACPAISGITFRVHGESGVPDDDYDFWETLFEAFGKCGRKVEIDMHAKNVNQRMIDIALETGMPVTLSPKYWAEHQGLGYIPASIRTRDMNKEKYIEQPSGVGLDSRRFTRYSYGDYFREDRPFNILHRIWPGTQHLLLSGDPVLSAAYGKVSGFCGGLGFELLDPLTFKGRRASEGNVGRCAYLDKSLEPKYDWEKFLYTYRIYGRLSYNPASEAEVWRRFLKAEYPGASDEVEKSLSSASQVLILITTAHGPSADCSVYWPEVMTHIPIVTENPNEPHRDTDLPRIFGNVSPHDPQLFSSINEYADALLDGKALHKYTSLEVTQRLEDLSLSAMENLKQASNTVKDKNSVSFRRLSADIRIQSDIARFFAIKTRSAVLWRIYEKSGSHEVLAKATALYKQARDIWADMAEYAKAVYVQDITFGDRKVLRGHWMDRLASIESDISDMEKKLSESPSNNAVKLNPEVIDHAVSSALSHPKRVFADCRHTSRGKFRSGEDINISINVPSEAKNVTLYYRRVNQALNWQALPMNVKASGQYQAAIPAEYTKTKFPMQYYFGLDLKDDYTAIYPGLDESFMNQPYYVLRQEI